MKVDEDFFAVIRSLIDVWCDRRALRPLSDLLPSYTSFNGMTDGWGELYRALRDIVAMHADDLTETERQQVHDLIQAIWRAIDR
jgi:hypothetical protein